MKSTFLVLGMAAVGIVLGVLAASANVRFTQTSPTVAQAWWASNAVTVAEQASEATAIVRVRVEGAIRTYGVMKPLPADGPANGRPLFDVVPFTETSLQVLEVFKGNVGERIVVSQTGGKLPASDQSRSMNLQVADDPLYVTGSEHILFLVRRADCQRPRGSAQLRPSELPTGGHWNCPLMAIRTARRGVS